MNRLYKKDTALLSSIFMLSCLFSTNATAQMTDSPWSFNGQNRASIAALIQQVEEGSNSSSVTSSSDSGSTTTLVCGSNSSDSTATGNSVCIILNNSEGAISVGQDNTGIQDARSEEHNV